MEATLNTDPPKVSVLILTLNEELNLPACLDSLAWCDDVVVVDSFSTDCTEEICRKRNIRVVQNKFVGFGSQRQWALENLPFAHDWILVLDADERVPEKLAREIGDVLSDTPAEVAAFRIRRRFYFWGRWLRYSSLYPSWVVRLVQKDRVQYVDRGHAETQVVDGVIGDLKNDLIDENRKGIDEWFSRQNNYSRHEADYEIAEEGGVGTFRSLFSADPLARRAALKQLAWRLPGRGVIYFLYSYIWCRGFLDGRDGLAFCIMRSMYQSMIAMKKYDRRRMARASTYSLSRNGGDS